jgi:23S rRNA (cytidine2498-2'-O)-methyltransferase
VVDGRIPSGVQVSQSGFLFATCQVGAERALKGELARTGPSLRLAFSRPGFLTFKLPEGLAVESFVLDSVFARAWGFSLGKIRAETLDARAGEFCRAIDGLRCDALHVWQRDSHAPGVRGFEPRVTPSAIEAETAILHHWHEASSAAAPARIATIGQHVVDCTLVEKDEWWIGWHVARTGDACFPGGLREIVAPEGAVSRAWVKMEEALAWSELPVRAGQRIVEIGCAPGGASQALLDRGLRVIGIDPAKVDPRVLAHPNFRHIQKRGADVRRRDLRGVDWLAADMNVAPQYTLDTVEAIVTHPSVSVKGLLLTLKLLDWELAEHVDDYLDRVRSWGYRNVRARQLAHNRQEICVAARRRSKRG